MDSFLLKISGAGFVVRHDIDDVPICTNIPSIAMHMDYPTADDFCQYLRRLGHQAVVCDIFGTEADIDVIQRALAPTQDVPAVGAQR